MKKHICTHCGEEFTGKKRKYCNDKCRHEYNKVRKRKQYRLDNNIKSRSCPICDKEFEPNRNGALTKYCSQDCSDEARRIRNKNRYRKEVGFDLEHKANCLYCGADISEQKIGTIYCSEQCGYSYRYHKASKEEVGKKQLYKQIIKIIKDTSNLKIKQQEEEQKQLLKMIKEKEREEKRKEEEKRKILEGTKKCIVCEQEFYNIQPNAKTCGEECRRKLKNKKRKLYDKKKMKKAVIVDKNITLRKLYIRDKGVCHICGGLCNYEDYNNNDAFIVGKDYPSIDHVYPISKGGEHSWDNVRLAHHYCNTIKNDSLLA